MKFNFLAVFLLIAINLIAIELVLEIRATNRGFSGFLLDRLTAAKASGTPQKQKFEFRSKKLDLEKPKNSIRIWMASASYAEDYKRKVEELFPNIMCREVGTSSKKHCQMLNASKAGYSIQNNIDQLKASAKNWSPDYVLLYSMNLDINNLSDRYLNPNFDSTENAAAEGGKNDHSMDLPLDMKIEKTLEQMSIYGHLRTYLGGSVLLSTLLHKDIGSAAKNHFKNTLVEFINAAREIGAVPILISFSTAYNTENFERMSYKDKLFLVRYNPYLSDQGWVNTVETLNDILRSTAIENDVHYIDLEQNLSGKNQYFTDFVHFTRQGHEFIGELLASEFIKILKNNSEN